MIQTLADATERNAQLMEANEHLVLALLRAESAAEVAAATLDALRTSTLRDAPPIAVGDPSGLSALDGAPPDGPDPQLRDLREANEQLVIALLAAQTLEAGATEAHSRQIKFLAMVAHELRNPLAPIVNAAELLNRAHTDDQLLAKLQIIIKRQVGHLSRLVEDLLDGSRVSTGKFRFERGVVDIGAVVALAVEACRPATEAKAQTLAFVRPSVQRELIGDPVRLAQVFGNLLDNACKYTPRRGRISLVVQFFDNEVTVTVSDDGIGISAEALPRIFDLFVQDARAPGIDCRGLGIGLAVVRDLVQRHGGTVIGRSAGADQGSEFTVTLPLAALPKATGAFG